MKKTKLLALLLVMLFALPAMSEQWRLHPTFSEYLNRIIETPKYTYLLSGNQPYWSHIPDNSKHENFLYRYDKDEKEVLWLNVQNKLSGSVVVTVEYDYPNRCLIICYGDGNVDLLYDNGEVVNVPGLKVADSYSKNIGSITVAPGTHLVYLATDFGYLTIDEQKGEVGTSRILDKSFTAAVDFDDKIYLGASDGIYYTSSRGSSDLTKIADNNLVSRFAICGDRLYVIGGKSGSQYFGYIQKGESTPKLNILLKGMINAFEPVSDGLLVSGPSDVWHYSTDGRVDHYVKDPSLAGKMTVKGERDSFLVDFGMNGVKKYEPVAGSSTWKDANETILPIASNTYKSTSMAYSDKYGMLVRNHGNDYNFTSIEPSTPDYISGLKGMEWTSYSPAALDPGNQALSVGNPNGIAFDPDNKDVVYCASVLDGILALNLADISKSYRIGRTNDSAMGMPGYIGAIHPGDMLAHYAPLTDPVFDSNGNLWTLYFDIDRNHPQLWYWTADARKGTTSQSDFKPFGKWVFDKHAGSVVGRVIPLSTQGSRNIIVVAIRENNVMKVIDHNGTLDNRDDDKEYTFTSNIYDQDGNVVDCGYYSAFYEDPSTGYLWVGAARGVFYFNPREMSAGGDTRVNRVKVARNDGTSLADYLLDGVDVNVIAADGKGRKWFATNGGGLVCTSANGAEIIKTYTAENSLLPGNTVYGLCYNPENNSMMISTDSGLAELFLSNTSVETEENDKDSVVIYPNPVRPDYYGYINIEGVEEGALVKIADSAGNIIKELGFAADGTIRWDGTNYNNKRVRSGVYYVLASGGPESSGFGAVGKILVVN